MDSISLRMHCDLGIRGEQNPNRDLFRTLLFASKQNQSRLNLDVDFVKYSVPIYANDLALKPVDYVFDELEFSDSGKRRKIVNGRLKLPSYHYDAGYYLNYDKKTIDISFSIPKYIYGHSVAQFVRNPHFSNRHHNPFKTDLESVTAEWWEMLRMAIKDFFNVAFPQYDVDYSRVEIIRLDLAFNQYFEDKQTAMKMAQLMGVKRASSIRGKRGRKQFYVSDEETTEDAHEKINAESTGFFAIQKNAYFKIYHKGTEFAKNDYKRIARKNKIMMSEMHSAFFTVGEDWYKKNVVDRDNINNADNDIRDKFEKQLRASGLNFRQWCKKKGKEILMANYSDTTDALHLVDELQQEADLILRHEIRFIPRSFSYYWKNHVYQNEVWDEMKHEYKKLHAKYVRYSRSGRDEDRLTKFEYFKYKEYASNIRKRHRFFLAPPKKTNHELVAPHETQESVFSKDLFKFLVNKFIEIVNDVQIKEFPEWDTLKMKVESHNEMAERSVVKIDKIPIVSIQRAYDFFINYGSLDAAYDEGKIKKSTYYRWRSQLKKLGYTSTMAKIAIKNDVSFKTYFDRIKGHDKYATPRHNVYFKSLQPKYKQVF